MPPHLSGSEQQALILIQTVLLGIFGSLLGSFCNVVILRIAEGRSVVFPPSACPHCRHPLSPLDLIPIFGWVLLRGRCRYCAAPISGQYPLVELVTALTLAFSFHSYGATPRFVPTAAWCVIWMVVAVLHFREEVKLPAPFLWPLAIFAVLGLWAGVSPWSRMAGAAGLALVGGFLASRAEQTAARFPWAGSTLVAGLGLPVLGWGGVAAVLAAAALFPHLGEGRSRMALKIVVLGVHLWGISLGVRGGFWG